MNKPALVVALGVALFCWETTVSAQRNSTEAESGARKALETFMTEWNTGEDARVRTAMNFPFVTFGGGSSVVVSETAEDFSQGFDRLRERYGWDSSSFDYDSLKIFMSSADKVHLALDFNRYQADGELYFTGNVFYVITKKEDHWGIQMRSGGGGEEPSEDRAEILAGARAAVLGYMKAFNAADADETSSHLNYPHLFMMGGRVALAEDGSARPNFEQMRTSEGWHFSTFDSLEPSLVTPNKVHWEIVFSRWHPDGTRYWSVPAMWITTKVGDHWGIQLRSLMPATFDER